MSIDQVIAKYILGKESSDELDQLEVWKSEAQENLESLKAMQALWKDSDVLLDYQEFDTEAGLARFENSIAVESKQPKAKVRTLNWKVMSSIAASLVVLLSAVFLMNDNDISTITPYTASEQVQEINLTDGTVVQLDQDSHIEYVNSDESQIFDLEGRAYFDVAKQNNRSFIINTNQGTVRVVGTRFVVNTSDDITTVTVEEGIVVYSINDKKYRLTEGNKLVHNATGIKVTDVNNDNLISWVDNSLVFKNVKVKSVLSDLEDHFNVSITKSKSKAINYKCNISSSFKNQTFENILEELSVTIGLEYHIDNGSYVIDAIQC